MSNVKYLRSARHEICTILLVLALPIILFAFFPFKALTFAPARVEQNGKTIFELVRISPEYERSLMTTIRSTWSAGRNTSVLTVPEIPMELPAEVLNVRLNTLFPPSLPCADFIKYDYIPMPISLAQGAYAELPPTESDEKTETFSKEELLVLPELN